MIDGVGIRIVRIKTFGNNPSSGLDHAATEVDGEGREAGALEIIDNEIIRAAATIDEEIFNSSADEQLIIEAGDHRSSGICHRDIICSSAT